MPYGFHLWTDSHSGKFLQIEEFKCKIAPLCYIVVPLSSLPRSHSLTGHFRSICSCSIILRQSSQYLVMFTGSKCVASFLDRIFQAALLYKELVVFLQASKENRLGGGKQGVDRDVSRCHRTLSN